MTREGTKKRSHKYEIGFEIRQSISVSKCGQGRLIKILCFLKEFCVHALQAFIALDLTNDHCAWEILCPNNRKEYKSKKIGMLMD